MADAAADGSVAQTQDEGDQREQQKSEPPLSFNWRKGKCLVFAVLSAHAVVLNGKVYLSGSCLREHEDYTIQVYTPDTDEWSELPKCPVKFFRLAVVNQQLVIVSGSDNMDEVESTLRVWDSTSQGWTSPYPDIPSDVKDVSAAFGYQQYLVVIGCRDGDDVKESSVQILDTSSNQWFTATPLLATAIVSSAIVGDTLYVFERVSNPRINRMLSIDLPTLVSCATSSSSPDSPPSWEVTALDFRYFTAVGVHGSLLSVGGLGDRFPTPDGLFDVQSDIRCYDPQTKKWNKVGDLPDPVFNCACCVLPSGELMVVGGKGKRSSYWQVNIATVV